MPNHRAKSTAKKCRQQICTIGCQLHGYPEELVVYFLILLTYHKF
jgi:hypothetical protein